MSLFIKHRGALRDLAARPTNHNVSLAPLRFFALYGSLPRIARKGGSEDLANQRWLINHRLAMIDRFQTLPRRARSGSGV